MSNDKHKSPDHASPYPISRLAPKFDMINVPVEIEKATHVLSAVARGKLEVIERQIRNLQLEAMLIIQKAQDDLILHSAEIRFHRKAGQTYHLYQRQDGTRYFSLASPEEWSSMQPHDFIGSFLLEDDMSWNRVE